MINNAISNSKTCAHRFPATSLTMTRINEASSDPAQCTTSQSCHKHPMLRETPPSHNTSRYSLGSSSTRRSLDATPSKMAVRINSDNAAKTYSRVRVSVLACCRSPATRRLASVACAVLMLSTDAVFSITLFGTAPRHWLSGRAKKVKEKKEDTVVAGRESSLEQLSNQLHVATSCLLYVFGIIWMRSALTIKGT
jgi:hypothetical protein